MYEETLTISDDIIEAYIERFDAVPALTKGFLRRLKVRTESRLLTKLRKEPGAPDYPIDWTSDRQRKKVMALLRENGNLPYQRTHQLSQGWDVFVTLDRDGGAITASNPFEESIYVYGPRQQRFLDKWPDADAEMLEEQARLESDLITAWVVLTDPFAGIPQ